MSELPKVGLLVCPRCQNLLPQFTGYSVFQCSGCGSVLRANNNNDEANASIEKLNDERGERSHKLEKFNSSDTKMMNLSDGSESDVKSNSSSKTQFDRKGFLCNKWGFDNDLESSKNYDTNNEMGNFQMPKEYGDLRTRNGDPNLNGSRRTVRRFDWQTRERSDIEHFQNTQKIDIENMSMYSEDGPSIYANRSNKVEYLEQDRAELVRKLDVLNKQIHQSCDLGDRSKELVHQERRVVHQDPYGGSMEYSILDKNVARPLYMDNRHQMAISSSQVQGFSDPFRSQMPSRAHRQPQPNSYLFGSDNDIPNMDPFRPYRNTTNLHHPSCSCSHCYNKHQPAPKRFSNVPKNPTFYNQENPNAFGLRNYDPRLANPPPLSYSNSHPHTRWPTEVNSEFEGGGFSSHRRRRMPPVATSGRRRCSPVSGGAPFVTCFNCFELLQLPKKLLPLVNKNQKKMKCGACSSIVFFTITNNKLVVSNHSEAEKSPQKVENKPNKSNVAMKVESSSTNMKWASTDFSSEDYDNSAYDFQSMDMKVASSSTDMRSLHTISSSVSEDDDGSSNLITRRNRSVSPVPPMTKTTSPPPKDSPLHEHLDYSTKYNGLNRQTIGNQSGRSEQGKTYEEKDQDSMKDNLGVNAIEIDISSNEFSNTGTSQDLGEGSRGEDQMRRIQREPYFGGIIKKSFKENLRSKTITEEERMSGVTVNGHLILDRLVKMAEKLAGPIQPGDYWYDFRAGFWGVMGGPCLGIIPPFIEEFNYQIRKDCAGGNTGILVNGRELTDKDLNLLGSRGLPTEENRSYVLEISGRILDVDSGEELVSLGKLAPTIEKMKRGFGMKVPRSARHA